MKEEAIVLTAVSASPQESNLTKVLNFFGVQARSITPEEFFVELNASEENSAKLRLLGSIEAFSSVLDGLGRSLETVCLWSKRVHSVFLYARGNPEILEAVVRRLTRNDRTSIGEINAKTGNFRVSEHWNDFCGVMGGVRVAGSAESAKANLVLNGSNQCRRNIISADDGTVFLMLEYEKVPVFLSTSGSIIDLDRELTSQNFEVREHFLSAVPVVLYIKWAFAETCWKSPEANACLVIDDPLLKPNYGWLNFEELLALMEHHHFTANIAFIPWNWRRSNSNVARLFKQKPGHYSLSIHGSDHVAAEFGTRDRDRLYWKARQAVDRMSGHETRTGISHDRIMVFPQGVFSEAAMDVLKRSNFTACVNTDVVSVDPHPPPIRISDVWDVAVMRYGGFPMFTRRYPSQEIANFAFDILLGKPCVIGIHHDFCCDRYEHLLDFINRLNALRYPLSWRSLGEVVRRSCRQREVSPCLSEIEMYGAELRLENHSGQRQRYLIRRRESEPSAIKEIRAESRLLAWSFSEGYVRFEFELEPDQETIIAIRFHDFVGNSDGKENLSYRVKTRLRRYLSEVRDNYVMPTKSRLASFVSR